MKAFLIDKFEFDLACNLKWCKLIEENEDKINGNITKWMSHIINAHHIWNKRIQNKHPESKVWDVFLPYHFIALHRDNTRETLELIEHLEEDHKIIYDGVTALKFNNQFYDVLYHILNHSNYHRAQIALECKKLGIETIATNYILYNRQF